MTVSYDGDVLFVSADHGSEIFEYATPHFLWQKDLGFSDSDTFRVSLSDNPKEGCHCQRIPSPLPPKNVRDPNRTTSKMCRNRVERH